MLMLLALLISWPTSAATYLHKNQALCASLLKKGLADLRIEQLLEAELVEPDNEYLFSPRIPEDEHEHEYATAEILASRLRRTTVLMPRIGRISTPTVDGIFFDKEGFATHNFSLKTFVPESWEKSDHTNLRLGSVLGKAMDSVQRRYRRARWRAIFQRLIAPYLTKGDFDKECSLIYRVFGMHAEWTRPLVLVVDYSPDPAATFRIRSRVLPDGRRGTWIGLNDREHMLSLDLIQEELAKYPDIEEVILIGRHNLLTLDAKNYDLLEVCDHYGHREVNP